MSGQKVVLLHGLFCNGWVMSKLAFELRKLNYLTLTPSYPTLRQSVEQGAVDLRDIIYNFKGDDSLYFVGHSMGGIMLRYLQYLYPDLFENSRVVTLGTPHQGSQFAQKIHTRWPAFVLGKSWDNSLDGNVPLWNPDIPLLSIRGTKTSIENKVVKVFSNDVVNDGLVGVSETEMPQIQAYKSIHQSHMKLCFSSEVVAWIDEWFQKLT